MGSPLLALTFFIIWISGALEFLALQDQVYSWLTSMLALQVSIGSVTITLSDVLTFLTVFIGGVLIATLIRFVLRVDILGRFNLKHWHSIRYRHDYLLCNGASRLPSRCGCFGC